MNKLKLPELSHLEYAVLSSLDATVSVRGEWCKELWEKLTSIGYYSATFSSFYRFMWELENRKLVKGRFGIPLGSPRRNRQRKYIVSLMGRKRAIKSREFYAPGIRFN
ncbi:MAG: hypothetical protein ABI430_03905 [Candidatus Taylorbacteria bacterium]